MEIKQNKSSGPNATRCRSSGRLMRIDRASGVKRSWVILVWALIATLWCVDAANQQQHQTLAIKQQPNSAKNDFDKRNTQIPIAQQEATSTEKLEAIGKNSSLSDDLLVAASSTTASTLVTSSAPVQQRQSSVATTGSGGIRGAADTTATSASSPSTPAVGSTTESSKRRPTAAGSAKLTQSTSVNRHLASGGRQQKQHANEPQSQRLPSAAGSESRQHSSAGTELIERMSTSRSVTFAEPPAEATGNKIGRQSPAQSPGQSGQSGAAAAAASTVSNRWTHFGARLKPLATAPLPHDHYEGAPNSPAYSRVSSQPAGRKPTSATKAQVHAKSTNELADDDQDDADDDQDSEALLYKMMQQQSFLMSPNWQQQLDSTAVGGNQHGGQQQVHQSSDQRPQLGAGGQVMGEKDSKRVIKLLKSYSHIHQVDDSGDQIRGSYTRFASRRQQKPADDRSRHDWESMQPAGGNTLHAGRHSRTRPQTSGKRPASTQQPRVEASELGDEAEDDASQPAPASGASENQEAASSGQEPGAAAVATGAPDEEEFECPNNGIFADEASGCQSYHVCQAGAQVQEKFQCPMGTLFNNIILTCDFAHNVQCHGAAAKKAAKDAAAGAQEPASSPEASWQPTPQRRQQPQGPRRLQIGQSRYNQLTSASPVEQATSAYPPTSSTEESSGSGPSDDDDSGGDDAPLEPLKPAQLPPSRSFKAANLPYSQPPQPALDTMLAERQVGTEATPAFAYVANQSLPEPANKHNNVNIGQHYENAASGGQQVHGELGGNQPSGQQVQSDDQAQSFNLVINHGVPTRAQPALRPTEGDNNYLVANSAGGNKRQTHIEHAAVKPHNSHKSKKDSYSPLANANYQVPHKQQQPARLASGGSPGSSASKLAANQRGANYESQKHLKQQTTNKQRVSQEGAAPLTRPAVQLVTHQRHQLGSARPVLVDLTNERRQQGVSSDAINDGLLLLLRHEPGVGSQSANYYAAHRAQQQSGSNRRHVASASSQNPVVAATGSAGKALAVAPALVRPDSPIDAQLFPNVQRVLAETRAHSSEHSHRQRQQVGANHGSAAAASTQVAQTAPPTNGARVLGPLPPMEPPRPAPNQEASRPDGSGAASSAQSAPSQHNSLGQSKRLSQSSSSNSQQPGKKTKRLRASYLPAPARQQAELNSQQLDVSSSEKQIRVGAANATSSPATGTTATPASTSRRPQQV